MSFPRCLLQRATLSWVLVAFSANAQQTVDVTIVGYKFEPARVSIKPGDTVRWINREKRTSHSVLFVGSSPAFGGTESPRLFPDESWHLRFEKPGHYDYYCGPHNEMRGTVEVAE